MFKAVSVLDLTGGFYEGRAGAAPGCVHVRVAVNAVELAGIAVAGGMVLSTGAAYVYIPITIAGEVARFKFLATEAAAGFLT